MLLIAFPPLQWLAAKYLIPASGTGPDLATADTERQEFLAIGAPSKSNGDQVSARYVFEGGVSVLMQRTYGGGGGYGCSGRQNVRP